MTEKPGFLEEVKRRKVARVAVVYLAVAWAAAQVADVFVPALGLPDGIISVVAIVALVGFPVALVLGWTFEITPEEVRRTGKPSDPASGRWVSPATFAAVGSMVAIGFFAGSFFAGGDGDRADSALDPMAVAVLPFELRLDPIYDPLRGRADFQGLLSEMG